MHRLRSATTLAAALFFISPALLPQASAEAAKQPVAHGIAVDHMEPSVAPGNDFYQYANGAWIARTKIPADRASVGVFTTLLDESRKNVAAIVKEAAQSNAPAG